MRSASKSWQMSRETSRMISSMLLVEWMRFVTACSFLENASFALMSATLAGCIFGSRTALMVAPCELRAEIAQRARPRPAIIFLQQEFLVVLEHARAPAARRELHFPHRERALPRLQVRDEDVGAV